MEEIGQICVISYSVDLPRDTMAYSASWEFAKFVLLILFQLVTWNIVCPNKYDNVNVYIHSMTSYEDTDI